MWAALEGDSVGGLFFGILWSDLDETRSEFFALLSRTFLYRPEPSETTRNLRKLKKTNRSQTFFKNRLYVEIM